MKYSEFCSKIDAIVVANPNAKAWGEVVPFVPVGTIEVTALSEPTEPKASPKGNVGGMLSVCTPDNTRYSLYLGKNLTTKNDVDIKNGLKLRLTWENERVTKLEAV